VKTRWQQWGFRPASSKWLVGVIAGVCLVTSTGCGGTIYAITASSASSKLETAQALGAERYAPYEYYLAREHLQKAAEEAASADYGDAINFADVASDNAEKAIVLARDAHQGAGR
jgi:hypothetical protein